MARKKKAAQAEPIDTLKQVEAVNAAATENAPEKKAGGKAKAKKAPKVEKTSALDAAAKVLAEAGKPMNTKEMVDAMTAKGYWSSPNGLTPHATFYSAILREMNTKGDKTRFKKADRGQFTLA